jgi:Carboxypeptidase regulatory-like domain
VKRFLPVALCLCSGLAPAQDDRAAIEGQVLNGITGEPLKKAALTLQIIGIRGQPTVTVTDAGGQFAIQDIDPGRYVLSAERNGFVRQSYGSRSPNRPGTTLTIERGKRVTDIVIKLMPQGVMTGRILDEDNDPMANITVQALRYGYMQGKRQLVPAYSEQSNDLGEYRIHGLTAGKYYLIATVRNRPGEEGYPPVYYPGASEPTTAIQVDVAAGSEVRDIDMTLHRAHTVRVRGKIPDLPRGTPVRIIPRGSSFSFLGGGQMAQISSQEGDFEIRGVAPGSYVMLIDVQENGRHRSFRHALEVGNAGLEGITIPIPPDASVEGRVRVDGQGDINFGTLSVSLQLRDPTLMGMPTTHLKADGSFGIESVTPDSYDVNISGLPAGYYLKSASSSGQDVLDSGLTVTGGTAKLELVVSPAGGQVEGVVTDDKQQAAKAATVVLIPEARLQSRLSLFKTAAADQNGHYSIQGIAPGDYTVYAFEDLPPGAFQDPDFMKPFERSAQSLTLREGGHESQQLLQIPADEAQF